MNNSITKEYLQQFRLRTARTKKRMQHEDFGKQLRSLDRERTKLHIQKQELGWIELKEPIMRGWKRYFVLRKDIARSGSKAFFENLLRKVNTVQYCHRKDFKRKKRKGGKKVYFPINQYLLKPGKWYIQKHKFTEKELSYFEERAVYKQGRITTEMEYVIKQPWRFVLRVRPNLITHVQTIDTKIEKRIQEIDNYLERNDLNKTLTSLLYGSYKWKEYRLKEIEYKSNPLLNRSLTQVLDLCKVEQG